MPTIVPPNNAYNSLCTVNQCLLQVVGQVDRNPSAQFSACVSLFGSPTSTTVTPSVDVVYSTVTSTTSYIDIIVDVSTAEVTDYETSTSYTDLVETVTDYTATSIDTVTVTAQTPTTLPAVTDKRRSPKRRRGCKGGSTSSDASSSTPATSTSALYPIASNCPSLEEYSSACSCIFAVSSTSTVTAPASTSTSLSVVTESSAILSTSISTATGLMTDTVVEPATSTVISTILGVYESTTTATATPTPSVSVPMFSLGLEGLIDQEYIGSVGVANGVVEPVNDSNKVQISFAPVAYQPHLTADASQKLFTHARGANAYGLVFESDAEAAANGDAAVLCTFDGFSVSCTSPVTGGDTFSLCDDNKFYLEPASSDAGCGPVMWQTA